MFNKGKQKLEAFEIRAMLCKTNIDPKKFPWKSCGNALLVTKRWRLVPVIVENPTHDPRVEEAIGIINKTLCPHISVDPLLAEGSVADAANRGIIVSIGSAVGGPEQPRHTVVGNVSEGPFKTAFPPNFVHADGTIDAVLYVNLDSSYNDESGKRRNVTATVRHVVHEFGHALGLGDHFDGFAGRMDPDPAGVSFWSVLATLYNTPVGSAYEDIKIPPCVADRQWLNSLY